MSKINILAFLFKIKKYFRHITVFCTILLFFHNYLHIIVIRDAVVKFLKLNTLVTKKQYARSSQTLSFITF